MFKAGDAVEVFSRSKNEWYPGKVKAVEAGEATVLYFVGVSDYYWDHPPPIVALSYRACCCAR